MFPGLLVTQAVHVERVHARADQVDHPVGDEVEAKFIAIDRKSRSLNLSIKAKDYDEEVEVIRSYSSKSQSQGGGGTLGDLLKEQMESGDND